MSGKWKPGRGRGYTVVALDRSLDLLLALAARRFGMDLQEIQETLGVARRTVYRHLHALVEAGVRLEFRWEPGPTQRHRLIRLLDVRGFKFVRSDVMQTTTARGRSAGQR